MSAALNSTIRTSLAQFTVCSDLVVVELDGRTTALDAAANVCSGWVPAVNSGSTEA